MRKFSFRPALTLRGREFRGPRGLAGKPAHPPLTDVPIAAYLFAALFDLLSFVGVGPERQLYRSATFVLIGGALVSLPTAGTGFWDWLRSTEKGTQVRRTANAHAWTMIAVTILVLANIAARWFAYWDHASTPVAALALSLAAAGLTFVGSALGGSLVFDYGFNVENSSDHPAWHVSERDVGPGSGDQGSVP